MKKVLLYLAIGTLSLGAVSCNSLFDNLEGDLSKISGEYLAESEAGLSRMMAALYNKIPMGAFSEGEKNTDNATDTQGSAILVGGTSFWDYTTMRDVNNLIKILGTSKEKGTISESVYNTYLGEAIFVRAYYYFGMVKRYGGVPIVTEPLDDKYDGDKNEGLYIPRSTEKETWDFVLSELDHAIALLPETRSDGEYRADKWAALGLQSRVALYAASVSRYWKKAEIPSCEPVTKGLTYMEESYAKAYYTKCIEACETIINSGRFSLYQPEPQSLDDAVKNLTNLFQTREACEWIFGKGYNGGVQGDTNGFDWKNSPMQAKFSGGLGVWKWGCYSVNSDVADLFSNYDESFNAVDGTVKTLLWGDEKNWLPQVYSDNKTASTQWYQGYPEAKDPFAKKDARFQAWVIYPGCTFRGTQITIQGGLWDNVKGLQICGSEKDYITYTNAEGQEVKVYMYGAESPDNFSGFHGRGRSNDGSWYTTGFGIRKFLNPNAAEQYSVVPWYDIRFTEILLNYIEAIVERDGTNAGKSKEYLNAIRRRAFFHDQVEANLDNVLKERRLELMFEEDRAMTMHRRREFYRQGTDVQEYQARRHAIIPVVDVRWGAPRYVFIRANMFADDTDKQPIAYSVQAENYYGPISNYIKNRLVPNPSQLL